MGIYETGVSGGRKVPFFWPAALGEEVEDSPGEVRLGNVWKDQDLVGRGAPRLFRNLMKGVEGSGLYTDVGCTGRDVNVRP